MTAQRIRIRDAIVAAWLGLTGFYIVANVAAVAIAKLVEWAG